MKIEYFKNKKGIITMCLFFLVFIATGQQRQINGSVLSDDGQPLPGANILVEGTKTGTTSDFDGTFKISVNEGANLIVSYIGYLDTKIKVTSKINYSIKLQSSSNNLAEVVVTGYTKEKKSDINGAISIVNIDDLKAGSTPNVVSKLQGRVAGLSFTSSGVPGGNDTQISIRGLTSVFGGLGPLWVIDGVQTNSSAGLNPNDIQSIQVLKDAASAGIYGTEAARGVIIVTTKQAKSGKQVITLDTRTTLNTVRESFNVLGGQQWLDVRYKAQGNTPVAVGNFTYVPGTPLPEFLDDNKNLRLSNTDWIDVILKESFSSTTDFGYSYANDKWKIFAGLGHAKDDGIIEHTFYERFNLRLNSSIKLFKDRLTIGENLTVINFREVKGNSMEDAILQNPLIPIYGEDGTWGGPAGAGLQDKWNPLAILENNKDNEQKTWRTFGNIYADYNFNKNFVFSSKLNFDINEFKFDEHTGAFNQNGSILGNRILLGGEEFARYSRNRNSSETYILTNLLTFNKVYGDHSIGAFIGQEVYKKDQTNEFQRLQVPFGTNVDFENYQNYDIISDSNSLDAYGIGADSRRESLFAKASYDFSKKYFFTASVRRDGSSRFGQNNRYSTFPTASVGWTVNKEKFLEDSKLVNNLKLRASWGGNGNADILEYAQYSIYNMAVENSNYDLSGGGNGNINTGVSPNQIGNPDLKWEQTYQTNIGFDLGIFDNHVNLTVDVYEKKTTDLLLQVVQPSVLGEAGKTLFFNAGDMVNRGVEAMLGYKSKTQNDFNYGVDLIFSSYRNEVTKLNNSDNFILDGISYTGVGQPIGSYYGYVADGIFRTPEEVAVHANQTGKALGNIRYRDINGDGVIDQDDRRIIGNPHPDFTYSMNLFASYKNWDLTLFFDGRQGNDMYNAQREMLDFPYFGFNHGLNTLDAWAPDNANSLIPALNTTDANDQRRASTYFIEDGSYFRLKNVNLSYNLNPKVFKGITSGRIYLEAENVFSTTSFSGFDYEVPGLSRTGIGIAGLGVYPHTKTFSLGVNLQF